MWIRDAAGKTGPAEDDMVTAQDLTADFCLGVVIDSTPHPNRFLKTDDPSVKQLFDLGVVDALSSAFFVQGVKERIAPMLIADASIASTRNTTVQAAADSVQAGAYSAGENG